eukprot:2367932-Pyramimonas_sp.AAC.1
MQPEFVGSRDIINRVEFTRLLEQSLCDLGYPRCDVDRVGVLTFVPFSIAKALEEASGVDMQSQIVQQFRYGPRSLKEW